MKDERCESARRLAQAQDAMVQQLDATRRHRGTRFVAAARRRSATPARGRRVVLFVTAVAVTAAGVVMLLARREELPDPVVAVAPVMPTRSPGRADPASVGNGAAVTQTLHTQAGAKTVELDGGGSLLLAAGTSARLKVAPEMTAVVLESGSVRVDVRERLGTVKVRAGDFVVRGRHSLAEVTWSREIRTLAVSVQYGEVEIESVLAGTYQNVFAGQSVRLGRVTEIKGPKLVAPVTPSKPAPQKTHASVWRDLLGAGKSADALREAIAGDFGRVLKTATAKELLALARAARYAKDTKHAKAALTAIRTRFPRSAASARAAYTLGRLAFDGDHDYEAAAGWFERYLEERPAGALTREALGRLIECLRRTGAAANARVHAARYLKDFPAGPHADIARNSL